MRYIKVFLLVLVFFFVMMFFVQNQGSFSEPVVLRLDLLFLEPMESIPMPLYSLMLICFTLGGLMVLPLLMWDRMTTTGCLAGARRRIASLEKQLKAAHESADAEKEKLNAEKAELQAALEAAEQRAAKTGASSSLDSLD